MATDPAALAESLLDLEVRVAYQDRTITALDEVVRALHARVDSLEKELVELRAGAASPALAIGPANDPPPHY
jgi:uncharacterized coiled-coil protein SlyX